MIRVFGVTSRRLVIWRENKNVLKFDIHEITFKMGMRYLEKLFRTLFPNEYSIKLDNKLSKAKFSLAC